MLELKREKIEKATRSANDKFARAEAREADFRMERQKRLDADAVKTVKLRALRMAKEATEREARAKVLAEKQAAIEAKRTAAAQRKAAKH